MPRLFIGIPLPDEYKDRLAETVRELRQRLASKVKWVRPENAHITLKFLGQVDDEVVDLIRQELAGILFPSFTLKAGELGCFPNMKRPRVTWVGLEEGGPPCAQLAGRIEGAMEGLGFEREQREFRSHLTLGRVKKLKDDDWDKAFARATQEWPEFVVDRFILWESELTPTGPIYTVVEEYLLGE